MQYEYAISPYPCCILVLDMILDTIGANLSFHKIKRITKSD